MLCNMLTCWIYVCISYQNCCRRTETSRLLVWSSMQYFWETTSIILFISFHITTKEMLFQIELKINLLWRSTKLCGKRIRISEFTFSNTGCKFILTQTNTLWDNRTIKTMYLNIGEQSANHVTDGSSGVNLKDIDGTKFNISQPSWQRNGNKIIYFGAKCITCK